MPVSPLSAAFILPFLLAAVFASFIIWMWTFKRPKQLPLSHILPELGFFLVSLWGLLAAITALDLHTQPQPYACMAGVIAGCIVCVLSSVCSRLSRSLLTE